MGIKAGAMARKLILGAGCLLLLCSVQAQDIVPFSSPPICENFLGLGAEWDIDGYAKAGISTEDFGQITTRVRAMGLGVVRVMMQLRWCYREGGVFEWDSVKMQHLYQQLDFCQQEGIRVILTEWGCATWAKAPGIKGVDDPKYAQAIARYMAYLIEERGYDCIRYFVFVNEPNYETGSWEEWKAGLLQVRQAFSAYPWHERLVLMGSDESNASEWHERAVQEMKDVLGAYDVHAYVKDDMVRSGALETFFAKHWTCVREGDANWREKPLVVGEAGGQDGARHPTGNVRIDSFEYGLLMADYAIQALRAGSHSVCIWQLDDNGHDGFYWGLMRTKTSGLGLRRVGYAWAMLSQAFPAGARMYAPAMSPSEQRCVAAQWKTGEHSIALLNWAEKAAKVTVDAPEMQGEVLCYMYNIACSPATEQALPAPWRQEKWTGVLQCPPRSLLVVRTVSGNS